MTVLYINYIEFFLSPSGSSIRPQKIYDALKKRNINIYMLTGMIGKKHRKIRLENIRKVYDWLKNNTPDYCYIESPGTSIIHKADRRLITEIHKLGIPIGYFYRDVYYKFPEILNNGSKSKSIINLIKFYYHRFQIFRDEKLLKGNVDVVFVPSDEIKKYLKFKNMVSLPPAGEILELNFNNCCQKSLIYVGGISKRYGVNLMLNAVEKANENTFIPLTIVCRENEKNAIDKKYLNCRWLTIVHASGKELNKYYDTAAIGLLPLEKCIYNDFAIAVKLFEYMSYNIPIIATDCTEQKKIIETEKIGLICTYDAEDMAKKILKLYNNNELINYFKINIKKSLNTKNSWQHRIDTIEKCLLYRGRENEEKIRTN